MNRPHQSYVVAATPRSGSTMLCDLLADTQVAGCPDEHFAGIGRERFPGAYAAALSAGTTANGVFGTKVMWQDLPGLVAGLRTLPGCDGRHAAEALGTAFPGLRFVHMVRGDKVAQAVSLWAAGHDAYSFEGIDGLRERLTLQERAWTSWFKATGTTPVTVVYEELVRSPRRVSHEVLARLDLEPADVPVPRLPRNPATHRKEWAERFSADGGSRRRDQAA